MDTTLLARSRQPLTTEHRSAKALQLLKRGYSENEVREIFKRARVWIEENVEPNYCGEINPLAFDFSSAVSEVLADSPDIALGKYR